jgi:hypothetical protein
MVTGFQQVGRWRDGLRSARALQNGGLMLEEATMTRQSATRTLIVALAICIGLPALAEANRGPMVGAGRNTRAMQRKRLVRKHKAPTQARRMVNRNQFRRVTRLWHARGMKGARARHQAATNRYASSKARYDHYNNLARRQMDRFSRSGNPKQKQWAEANRFRAMKAKVSMFRAHARGLEAKAKLAIKAGNPDAANAMLDRAAKLKQSADSFDGRLNEIAAHKGYASGSRGRGADVAGTAGTAVEGSAGSRSGRRAGGKQGTQQVMDAENPLTQASRQQRVPGLRSYIGKRRVKAQLASGNVQGALETYDRMQAQPNRGGARGLLDRYRKWGTRRRILKQSFKMGKRAARIGDVQLAGEALQAQTALRKPGFWTNRKLHKIGNQALKGARKFARTHRPEEASQLLALALKIQNATGRGIQRDDGSYKKPTWRYRRVLRTARKRLWKDLETRAKDGNMEAFRSAMRLANAYATEDGKRLKPRQVKKIRKLYLKAMKNSVPRALKDARLLLSGRMGYVNVEEAANRYAYAFDTANKLARRGIGIKTGLFRRSIQGQFRKTRKQLITAINKQSSLRDSRPGLMRRIYEKIFVQAHRRTQPTVAPLDSGWVAKQQRIQEMETARVAAEQGGAPAEM